MSSEERRPGLHRTPGLNPGFLRVSSGVTVKRLVLVLPLSLLVAAGCSSSPKAEAPPASAKAEPGAPSPEVVERERQLADQARLLMGLPPSNAENQDEGRQEWIIFEDEATGKKLQRIPKHQTIMLVDGKVRHAMLPRSSPGLQLVREDEQYYYVAAVEPARPSTPAGAEAPPEGLQKIVELPPEEYEPVTPAPSRIRLSFEEKSEGLPTSGFWRSNMAVADMDGDGRPEIVATPPRLAVGGFRIFRFDGAGWAAVDPRFESEEGLGFAYGGVAVADLNGDGKPDVLSAGHGAGPVVAFNQGGYRFRVESRGLPTEMSSRAVAAGDLDGDGKVDVIALSDEPEASRMKGPGQQMKPPSSGPQKAPEAGAYEKGHDLRVFIASPDGRYEQNLKGLESTCFGYSLEVTAPAPDGGKPFFVSDCRRIGGRTVVYEWDRAARSSVLRGLDIAERYSLHVGAALGSYAGKPAAYVAYAKGNPAVASARSMNGHGVSIYYREGTDWKRKRLIKVIEEKGGTESKGLGVGDLDGDGRDDLVWADVSTGRVRVFFQTARGEFEELDPSLQPRFVNHSMSVKVVDVDGDRRNDIVLMYEYRSTDRTRAGGLRYFRNLGPG